MLVSMKDILTHANKENYAVPAPNVATELDARAFLEVAEELQSPIILDVNYRANPDILLLGKMLIMLCEKSNVPAALHLDHGYPQNKFVQQLVALRAGFTSIMVDYSDLPFEENIAKTAEMTKIAHTLGVTVEAELGYVGQGKDYEKAEDMFTRPEQAAEFAERTGIDALAIAIGNAHGMYKGEPKLDLDRLVEIKNAAGGMPLVLHGSSFLKREELRKACTLGLNKINVNHEMMESAINHINQAEWDGDNTFQFYKVLRTGLKKRLSELILECYGSQGKAFPVRHSSINDVVMKVEGGFFSMSEI
jgi:fructose-bisphosphate aldolase class II